MQALASGGAHAGTGIMIQPHLWRVEAVAQPGLPVSGLSMAAALARVAGQSQR